MNEPHIQNDFIRNLADKYAEKMYSWAYFKTSSKEAAEDIVQNTFVAALQSIQNFRGESSAKTWLFSILNHKLNDYYKDSITKTKVLNNPFYVRHFESDGNWKNGFRPHEWQENSGNLLDNPEFLKVWTGCISNLPDNWKVLIRLKYINGINTKQICQDLNLNPTNYWQIVHRAKLHLRKCLEINWFDV